MFIFAVPVGVRVTIELSVRKNYVLNSNYHLQTKSSKIFEMCAHIKSKTMGAHKSV